MLEIIRIPEERIPVLLGKKGRVKGKIEKGTGTTIEVSEDVKLTGDDPLGFIRAKEIIKAIGRGFEPKVALKLLGEDCEFRMIGLEGETLKNRLRLFGRVIGQAGRTRKFIEKETGASLCIYGKTISLIGMPDEVSPAEGAVRELLLGKTHGYAYKKMLRQKMKE